MKKSQIDVIAEILIEHGHIDNFYAIEHRLTYRLGARIHDLRALGWEIETKEVPNKNTIYRLVVRSSIDQQSPGSGGITISAGT